MPKSKNKKRKLNHTHPYKGDTRSSGPTVNGDQSLTHEEIWDDSALLRSWDEAVAEYEFYHSIHARGEDVDEVLKQYRADNGEVDADDDDDDGIPAAAESNDEGEILEDKEEGEITETKDETDHLTTTITMKLDDDQTDLISTVNEQINDFMPSTSASPSSSRPHISAPNADDTTVNGHAQPSNLTQPTSNPAPLTDVTNQTLENIKMAYYWAGYYSGLYDGQRQAQSQPSAQHQTPSVAADPGSVTAVEIGTAKRDV